MRGRVVIDQIQFGIQESELDHKGLAGFARRHPVALCDYQGPSLIFGTSETREIRTWRNNATSIGFAFNLPRGASYKNLSVTLVLRRYRHPAGHADPVNETSIVLATEQMRSTGARILLPADEKWHYFTFDVSERIQESASSPSLSVIIDDTSNFRSVDAHYGCSITSAALLGEEDEPTFEVVPSRHSYTKPSGTETLSADVLLVICPVWDTTMPPISIAGIACHLRSHGVEVQVVDFNIDSFVSAGSDEIPLWHGYSARRWESPDFVAKVLERFGDRIEELTDRIAGSPARVVGFSVYNTNHHITGAVIERLKSKAPDKIVVVGGPGVVFCPSFGRWDFLVVGDGERPFFDIASGERSARRGVIPRASYNGKLTVDDIYAEPDLNALPLLDYVGFDLTKYASLAQTPAYTSRGCTRKCAYCFDARYYAPFRCLTGERAFGHFHNLYARHGCQKLELSDLLCNGDRRAVLEMARLIKGCGVDLRWGGFAIVRGDMSPEDYAVLREGGCDYLRYGFETGCEQFLRSMKRGYSKKTARQVLELTKASGIRVHINVLVGFPEETDETVAETIEFLRANAPFIDCIETINTVALMPLTPLFDEAGKFGIHWNDLGTWSTADHDAARRQRWAARVLEAVREAGIPTLGGPAGGMIEGAAVEIPFADRC